MREPINTGAPTDMGTPMGNHTLQEPPQTHDGEINQPLPHHTEALQPIQYRINDINENPTLPDPNTNSFYNNWGNTM